MVIEDFFEDSPKYLLFPLLTVVVILASAASIQFVGVENKLMQSVGVMGFDLRQRFASSRGRQSVIIRR